MGYFTLISGYASFSKCIRTLTHTHGDHLLGKAAHREQRCNRRPKPFTSAYYIIGVREKIAMKRNVLYVPHDTCGLR